MSVKNEESPVCNICNRFVVKLIPIEDKDQFHTGTILCKKCKKALKENTPIIKHKINAEELAIIERKLVEGQKKNFGGSFQCPTPNCNHTWGLEKFPTQWSGSKKVLNNIESSRGRKLNHCYCGFNLYKKVEVKI